MINLRLKIGNFITSLGWDLRPRYKVPRCTADLVGIAFALLRNQSSAEPLRVVQIGAFDGETADPLANYLQLHTDIEAVLLEPQSAPFEKLSAKYATFKNIQTWNSAIAEHDGVLQMWSNDTESGSAMASSLADHGARFAIADQSLKPISVPCMRAMSLMKKLNWKMVDFLQVDVEGADWKVVSQFLELDPLPRAINFEIIHLSKDEREESQERLTLLGYQIIDGGFDRMAFQKILLC